MLDSEKCRESIQNSTILFGSNLTFIFDERGLDFIFNAFIYFADKIGISIGLISKLLLPMPNSPFLFIPMPNSPFLLYQCLIHHFYLR